MTQEFNIGDTVWMSSCGTQEVQHPCPICFGKKRVTLILGDESTVKVYCDFCGAGFEGPRGFVTEYEWVANVRQVTVMGKEVRESDGKREITYHIGGGYIGRDDDVFSTKEGADARCAGKIAERAVSEKTRMEHSKEYNKKSYGWHAGYHMRCAKKAEHDVIYHTERAKHCKARAKTPQTEPQPA